MKTPGREDEELEAVPGAAVDKGLRQYRAMAEQILEGLGGNENIENFDFCVTRLRIDVKDMDQVDLDEFNRSGVTGTHKVGDKSLQVIVGTNAQFVYDEMMKLYKK